MSIKAGDQVKHKLKRKLKKQEAVAVIIERWGQKARQDRFRRKVPPPVILGGKP